jgi:hypothetical protein
MLAFLLTAADVLFTVTYAFLAILAIATAYHNRDEIARRVARAAIRVAVKFERGTRARRLAFRLNHKARRYAERVVKAYAAAGIV